MVELSKYPVLNNFLDKFNSFLVISNHKTFYPLAPRIRYFNKVFFPDIAVYKKKNSSIFLVALLKKKNKN